MYNLLQHHLAAGMQKNIELGSIRVVVFVNWKHVVKMWTVKFKVEKGENKERRGLMDHEKMEVSIGYKSC